MRTKPKTKIKHYPNGATLYYVENLTNKTTEYQVGYVCGAEKDNIPGTAHYLEHILAGTYIGTTKKQFESFCAENTIMKNAYTSKDSLVMFTDCPSSKFADCFDMSSKMLFNRNFDNKLIESERNAIVEEYYMASDKENNFQTIAARDDYENLIIGSDILGCEEDIRSITKQTLLDYAEENFVSQNLFCAVCSSLPFEEIEKQFEEKFVNPSKSDESKKNTATPYTRVRNVNKFFISELPTQKTNEIVVSINVKNNKEAPAFYNFVHFIFNTKHVFLNKLREEKGLVYSAHFGIRQDYDPTVLFYDFNMSTSKGKINECIDVLAKLLNSFKNKGVLEDTYNQFQNYCNSNLERMNNSTKVNLSAQVSNLIMGKGFKLSSSKDMMEQCKALTFEQVNTFMENIFINPTLEFTLAGDFQRDQVYSIQEIETKLGSIRSNVVDVKHRGNLYLTKKDKMMMLNNPELIEGNNQITEVYETRKLNERGQTTAYVDTFYKVIEKDVFHYCYSSNSTFVELANNNALYMVGGKLMFIDYDTEINARFIDGRLVIKNNKGINVDPKSEDAQKVLRSQEFLMIAAVEFFDNHKNTTFTEDQLEQLKSNYEYYLTLLKEHKQFCKKEITKQEREYLYEDRVVTKTTNNYLLSSCPHTKSRTLEDPLHNLYFNGESKTIEFMTVEGDLYFYDQQDGVCYDNGRGTFYPFDSKKIKVKEDVVCPTNVGVAVLLMLNNAKQENIGLRDIDLNYAKKVCSMIKSTIVKTTTKTAEKDAEAEEVEELLSTEDKIEEKTNF